MASASTTTTLINQFCVDFVVFTGVSGAVDTQLNIGDIVIGSGLYQHDMDARPFFDQFQIPLTTTVVFEPKTQYVENMASAAKQFVAQIDSVFDRELLSKFSIFKPSVHIGLIASGDKFISDPTIHDNLNVYHHGNKTLAVEMEGASVAQVCEEHTTPYIIIRVISDKACHSAAIDFQSFISEIASKYSSGIINEYFSFQK